MSSAIKATPETSISTPPLADASPEIPQAQLKRDRRQRQKSVKAKAAAGAQGTQGGGAAQVVSASPLASANTEAAHRSEPTIATKTSSSSEVKDNNHGWSKPPHIKPKAPCGCKKCPVKAVHPAKAYAENDPTLPNLIKKLKAKGDKTVDDEWAIIQRFFAAHKGGYQNHFDFEKKVFRHPGIRPGLSVVDD